MGACAAAIALGLLFPAIFLKRRLWGTPADSGKGKSLGVAAPGGVVGFGASGAFFLPGDFGAKAYNGPRACHGLQAYTAPHSGHEQGRETALQLTLHICRNV